MHRGHILAKDLGGTGRDVKNLTPLHARTNSPVMRGHEQEVKRQVVSGDNVKYRSTSIYMEGKILARGITIEAVGDNGYYKYVTILNRRY